MNKYNSIPSEIEAIQWTGENLSEIFKNIPLIYKKDNLIKGFMIFRNNHIKEAKISDWIIKTASGSYFIIPDLKFKESYKQI